MCLTLVRRGVYLGRFWYFKRSKHGRVRAGECRGLSQLMTPTPPTGPTVSQQLFGGAEDFVNRGGGSLGTSGQLVGAMTTEGVSQQMQAQQDFEREQQRMREKSEAKRRRANEDLRSAYAAAQPFASQLQPIPLYDEQKHSAHVRGSGRRGKDV